MPVYQAAHIINFAHISVINSWKKKKINNKKHQDLSHTKQRERVWSVCVCVYSNERFPSKWGRFLLAVKRQVNCLKVYTVAS